MQRNRVTVTCEPGRHAHILGWLLLVAAVLCAPGLAHAAPGFDGGTASVERQVALGNAAKIKNPVRQAAITEGPEIGHSTFFALDDVKTRGIVAAVQGARSFPRYVWNVAAPMSAKLQGLGSGTISVRGQQGRLGHDDIGRGIAAAVGLGLVGLGMGARLRAS